MIISRVKHTDLQDVAQLAHELWPDEDVVKLQQSFTAILSSEAHRAYICRLDDHVPVAFIHVSLRKDYVEGTHTSPVGYLEGIYVRPDHRNQGIGRNLLERGESWAKDQGCTEFASDADIRNQESHFFHTKAGFSEVSRIVCYTKSLTQQVPLVSATARDEME